MVLGRPWGPPGGRRGLPRKGVRTSGDGPLRSKKPLGGFCVGIFSVANTFESTGSCGHQ